MAPIASDSDETRVLSTAAQSQVAVGVLEPPTRCALASRSYSSSAGSTSRRNAHAQYAIAFGVA
jgi:hypothetical protein